MSNNSETTRLGSELAKNLLSKLSSRDPEEAQHIVESVIYDMANPNPIYVVIITLTILVLAYLLYKLYVMPNLNGVWIDSYGKKYRVEQNRLTGHFSTEILNTQSNEYFPEGKVSMNTVKLTNNFPYSVGHWDLKNKITFFRDTADHNTSSNSSGKIGSGLTTIWLRVV